MNTLWFSISNYSYFIVKQDKANLLMWILFLYFLNLRFNSTQHTLFPWDERFIFIVSSRKKVELSLISRFHKLLQHINFFLSHAELEICLSCNFRSGVHTSWNINTEDHCCIVICLSLLKSTFQHVDYIVFCWNFFFLNHDHICIVTEFTFPNTLIWF